MNTIKIKLSIQNENAKEFDTIEDAVLRIRNDIEQSIAFDGFDVHKLIYTIEYDRIA